MVDTIKFKVAAVVFAVMLGIVLTVTGLYFWERSDNKKLVETNTQLTQENKRLKDAQSISIKSDAVNEQTGAEITNEHRDVQEDKRNSAEDLQKQFDELVAKHRAATGDKDFAMGLDLDKLDELLQYEKGQVETEKTLESSEKTVAELRSVGQTLSKELKNAKAREAAHKQHMDEVNDLSLKSAWESYCKAAPQHRDCVAVE